MAKKTTAVDSTEETELPSVHPPADVIAFNELRSCADLFRLYEDGTLEIKPHFQREVVWSSVEKSRFIDSLTKQLPIPSMCFSLDYKTQKWQVVDGLQRMTAIVAFLNTAKPWKLSRIEDIDIDIRGKTNLQIQEGTDKQKILYKRVQNLSLPITVIRCDSERSDHSEYIFTIFQRLNSGGKKLNHQEIRNCIFSGPYNDHLDHLDQNPKWAKIKKLLPSNGSRFRSTELILRFFAIHERLAKYGGNLPKFLNEYMQSMRNSKPGIIQKQEKIFGAVVGHLARGLAKIEDTPITYTLIETAMTGIAFNIERVEKFNDILLAKRIKELASTYEISGADSKLGGARTSIVRERTLKARKIFSD